MTFSVLLQVFFDLILFATVAFLWAKSMRPQKDDPRLSRGLQLLQSKIAVLEDLSDQVESQVQQITALLEAKGRELQTHVTAADKQIQKIEVAMGKSLEVAEIFQDRIPHQEIIERQNTVKYVKAARLAHQGLELDQIAEQVELSRGELELIIKVNRDQLQFSEEDLPEWAKKEAGIETAPKAVMETAELESKPLARVQEGAKQVSLSSLGEKFRQALPTEEAGLTKGPVAKGITPNIEMPKKASANPALPSAQQTPAPVMTTGTTPQGKSVEVQKVLFPRIDMTQHLS